MGVALGSARFHYYDNSWMFFKTDRARLRKVFSKNKCRASLQFGFCI